MTFFLEPGFYFGEKTTQPLPSVAVLTSPENGSNLDATDITFSWNEITNSNFARVQISQSSAFNEPVIDTTDIAGTELVIDYLEPDADYFWRVRGNNEVGAGEWSDVWTFTANIPTNLNPEKLLPSEFALGQNYPNPFNPSTVIRYQLPVNSEIRLEVFDLIGRRVAVLVNEQIQAGTHEVRFDARHLSSGVYIYRLTAGSAVFTRKLTVIK